MDNLVRLEIPAKAEYVVLARLALAGLLRQQRFSEDAVTDLKLAITEACTNSVRHARKANGEGGSLIHVSLAMGADRVVMVVEDDGSGLEEERACDEPGRPNGGGLPTEGGMGMCIIRAVVDEFLLERPEAGGTRLTLTKLCDA